MISFATAKINLGLHITEKRSDGYHNIETIFYPVKLYDVIEIMEADNFTFHTQGIDTPSNGTNLCEKAYHLLTEDFKLKPVTIELLKNTPIGAGLGGGSSDAAFVLKMLNDWNNLNLSDAALENYAVKLGADCAFFIKNKPVFASGIGATFTPIDLDLTNYYIVIINPGIHISTVEAYSSVVPQNATIDLSKAIQLPIQEWKYHIKNDFELGIFEKYPIIQEIKTNLYKHGALYAAMSGSGSSVFGIFEKKVDLSELKQFGTIFYPTELS